jgi:hypothetical protein
MFDGPVRQIIQKTWFVKYFPKLSVWSLAWQRDTQRVISVKMNRQVKGREG